MNKLIEEENSIYCNICFQDDNITLKYKCSKCKYSMCNYCFDKYIIKYRNKICAHCRTKLDIQLPKTKIENIIFTCKFIYLKYIIPNFLFKLFTFLYLIGFCYSRNISFKYIVTNIAIGSQIFILFLFVIIWIVSSVMVCIYRYY